MFIDVQNRMWIIEVGRENFADPTGATTINAAAKVLVLDLATNVLDQTLSHEFPNAVVSGEAYIDTTFLFVRSAFVDASRTSFTNQTKLRHVPPMITPAACADSARSHTTAASSTILCSMSMAGSRTSLQPWVPG
jgi:hypothetical protein